ncbi:hypothetical protein [Ureibacillus manganicus]|uniref:Glucosamine 6-phosphate synthetase n=1 Tax=Ureibacillus manganicus DSM 26584 TaxID=1384049 RepID=A0A0A3I5Y2_9BACL|nr:hypothetical protein [Ureibacillus manganicus]KGR78915.1 glucosamine 6-phosphate synthetase [Ureibacillus manganicus DSM 26584]
MQNVSKRTFLWIVPILILVIFWFVYGPKEEITDNEYITFIKEQKLYESSKSYGEAFAQYCEDEKWIYFKTQKEQHVVEFKGSCPQNNELKKVNLQFVVENNQTGYERNVLLLDDEQQSAEQRDEFLSEVVF